MTALHVLLDATDTAVVAAIEQACRARGHKLFHGAGEGARRALLNSTAVDSAAVDSAAVDLAIVELTPPAHAAGGMLERLRRSGVGHVLAVLPRGGATLAGEPEGLEAFSAADDFLFKPFSAAELTLRLALAERHLEELAAARLREISLRESSELLPLAASGTNDGFWHCAVDPAGDYFNADRPIWYSKQMEALLGFDEHELPATVGAWSERLHPEDRDYVFQALRDHLERRVPYDVEYRLRLKSGGYRWFNARGQASWDEAGKPLRMAGSVRDVTDRRAADEAQRESEARYRLILDTANDIFWTIEIPDDLQLGAPAGEVAAAVTRVTISDISSAVERVLGYPQDEARALTLAELLSPTAYQAVLDAFIEEFHSPPSGSASPTLRTLELEHVAKTGEIRCYDVTCVVRRDQHGRPTSVLGVSRDITERLRAQQAVQKDRAFLRQLVDVHERERSVFAYEIHDGIMPRITASIMHLESSCAGHFLGAPERGEFEQGLSLLEVAISEGRRLISGLRPPILDEAGVVAAIEYLVSEYRPRIPGLTFTYTAQFDRLAPPLENAVFRVVQEALNNVSRHSFSQVASVELSATDDGLRIVVSDRGIGFDPLQVDERRFGLQGIRERARLLAGQAWIESAPGAGTVVRVDFPLLLAAATTGE